jgi:hypothetical protein
VRATKQKGAKFLKYNGPMKLELDKMAGNYILYCEQSLFYNLPDL